MIAGMTVYGICWYFLFYAFAGWVVEVAFHAVTCGKVINRGFLCGPVCPVYGFGVLTVFCCINTALPALGNAAGVDLTEARSLWGTLAIFFLGMVLTSLIEFLAGFILDAAFHMRWWDYRREPFNIGGYICLRFSILWGLAVLFVVRVIQPLIEEKTFLRIPERIGWPVLLVLYAVLLADFILTIMTVAGLNRKLRELDELRRRMMIPSDALSRGIAEPTLMAARTAGEARVQAALAKAELGDALDEVLDGAQKVIDEKKELLADRKKEAEERMSALSRRLSSKDLFGPGRILRAFPQIEHRYFRELLEELKDRVG